MCRTEKQKPPGGFLLLSIRVDFVAKEAFWVFILFGLFSFFFFIIELYRFCFFSSIGFLEIRLNLFGFHSCNLFDSIILRKSEYLMQMGMR